MDVTEQIKRYHDFIEKQYLDALYETVRKGENRLIVSFLKLIEFDPELANELLERPEECISAAEFAVKEFDLPAEVKNFRVRFNELSESQKMMIRNIRSKHLSKLFHIEGIVRQKSDVRPQVTSAKFECPSCGNIISVLQLEATFKEPSRCGCGRKGKFRLLSKELIDAQRLVLEEAPEDLDGGEQPKRIGVFLKDDLVSPMSDKKTNPGNKVMVTGIVKEVAKTGRDGSKLITFDLNIEANYIEPSQEDYYQMEITEEDEEKIKKIAYDPRVYTLISESIAPTIFGYERVKEAIALQLVGGVKKSRKDGTVTRGDMHVLLIGDPGSGKCVVGNTKIILDNGEITTIREFYDNNINNADLLNMQKVFSIDVDGLNFTSNTVRLWRRKAPEHLLKIVTSTGNELIVTEDHPLFTTKNGLIFGKNAIDFKIGEYIALPSKIDVNGSIQKIPLEIRHTPAHNKAKYDIKNIFDEEFARLLGYLVGDGYVRMRKTSGLISFTNKSKEILADFEKLVEKCFHRKVSKRRKQNSECYEYYTCSIELVRILQNMDECITKRSGDMKICKIVALSPNNILREFIRALFECEGSVSKSKREIEFSSKSKDLIFDLKYLLLRFGIISQVSPCIKYASNTENKTRRTYYRLRISGEQSIKFADNIGFISAEKTDKLLAWKRDDKKLNTNINIIPSIDNLLKTLRNTYDLSQSSFSIRRSTYQHYERGDRYPSHNKLRKIAARYNEINKEDPLVQILDKIANTDLFWDKIKSVETIKSEEDYVYDIEIETVHNFIANGVMVHNSQLLKRTSKIAPKARYVSGKGVSGAGLTASVVKDEFLGGWSLEAGALPLANKGFCVTGDTEVYMANGNLKRIDEIYNEFKNNNTEQEVYYLNPYNYKFENAKIVNVSKRTVDTTFKIETDTGQTIVATEEHPFAVWNNGLGWKEVKHLKEKDSLFAPRHFPISVNDEKNDDLYYFLGLIATDGHLSKKKYTVSFYTASEQLKDDFERLSVKLFGKKPGCSIDKRKSHYHLFICSKKIHRLIEGYGIPKGNKSINPMLPNILANSSTNEIKSFLIGAINGDGSISNRKSGGIIEIIYGNEANAYFYQKLFRKIGIISRVSKIHSKGGGVVKPGNYVVYKTSITGISDMKQLYDERLLSYKKESLVKIINREDRSWRIPNISLLLKKLHDAIPWFEKNMMYANSIRLSRINEKTEISRFALFNCIKDLEICNPANKTREYNELKKIIDNKIIFPRIKKITKLSSKREVYNIQLDKKEAPNFIANFLLVHNCLIDEMDKMSEEDTAAMHEALEGQTITISKANIQATLRAETTVLAAANPKLGRFDPYDILAKQIAMPPALINRFDLIFAFKDLPNTEKDERMATHILKLHQSPDIAEPEITTEILRKFISYARQNCHPVLSSEAIEELKTYYVQMRNSTNSEEAGMKAVPISARQLEALVRLAEATAKLRLGKEVTREDAKRAVDILHFSLSEIGIDPETGKIDIDRIASGITASQRTKIHKIKDIILELENKFGKNIPIQDIIEEAKLQGLTEDQVEEALEKLKRSGDLFEPTKGYVAGI